MKRIHNVATPAPRLARLGLIGAVLAVTGLAVTSSGCAKEETPSSETRRAPFEVRANAEGLVLFFWDEGGSHLAKGRDQIPEASRQYVRVDSLEVPPEERLPADQVYVADLREPVEGDRYAVRTMERSEFEAIGRRIQLLESQGRAPQRAKPRTDDEAPAVPSTTPQVIVYGASWCGVCRTTARYLRGRGIPFVEKDIEKDPSARDEMNRKARAAGVEPRGVPVIDVGGELLLGFDADALEMLLEANHGIPI